MNIITNKIKLKKEGFQDYSFKFKGKRYRVHYDIQEYDLPNTYLNQKGWQISLCTYNSYKPIFDFLKNTRKDALDTFLFNNA